MVIFQFANCKRLPGRVNLHFPMGFPMFSHFPMFSYGFSYCDWKSPLGESPSDRSKPHFGIGTSHHRFCEFQIPQDQWCTPWKNADFYVPNKDLFVGTRPCHQAEIDIFSFHLPSHKQTCRYGKSMVLRSNIIQKG
jgi:hypothetical protein